MNGLQDFVYFLPAVNCAQLVPTWFSYVVSVIFHLLRRKEKKLFLNNAALIFVFLQEVRNVFETPRC